MEMINRDVESLDGFQNLGFKLRGLALHRLTLLLILLLAFLFESKVFGASSDERKIKYAALGHMHFSAAQSDSAYIPYGFRLRRLDIRVWEPHDEGLAWSCLVGFSDFKFKILEADIAYAFSPALKLRLGQFIPPGARSAISMDFRYSATTMPFVERSMVTLNWVGHARLNAYRTFGFLVHGAVMQERLHYALMFSSPDGAHFFYPSNRQVMQENTLNGYGLWGRLEYDIQEDFNVGGFYNTRSIHGGQEQAYSYGSHLIYRKEGWKVMTEYIAGRVQAPLQIDQHYRGAFIDLSKRWGAIEPALRYDVYSPYSGDVDPLGFECYHNYTFGVNYYISEMLRVQCNYLLKLEQKHAVANFTDNNIFYINLQLFLH